MSELELAVDEAPPPSAASRPRAGAARIARDLVTLTKPRITFIVLVTAAGGMKLAPGVASGMTWLWAMLGTALVVGSANALNMWLERDVDGLMERTKKRPLPQGTLSPNLALAFGVALAIVSLPMLSLGVNAVTGVLGAIALVSYVLIYTPLKRRSIRALWVGAVPGAIPPLLGWTAVTGRVDRAGVALFALLFLWQIPHFLAISIFRAGDYERAGLKVVPVELGDRETDGMMVRYSLALLLVSLWPLFEGIGGKVYLAVALLLGAVFVAMSAREARHENRPKWAKRVFAYSIVYLVVIFGTLVAQGRAG